VVRVIVPSFLRTLAGVPDEARLDVAPPVTQRGVLDALEARYPALSGTIRDHETKRRRPLVRFYACSEDLSNDPPDAALPAAVARGEEPFLIVASIAGG
jgi:molybdopterin synthase sulfur carrier subunit